MLRPTVGLRLDGGAVGDGGQRGRIGEPVWGPMGLLADLEVRVGLIASETPHALRVQRYAQRMAALVGVDGGATMAAPGSAEPFYARSFAVDPIGTATMLLAWRDGLVEAGWAGTVVAGGGTRLAAFAALEAMAEPVMPPGTEDRLAAVEVEVSLLELSPYAELTFADDRRAWPYRWQGVFALLAERGTRLQRREGLSPAAAGPTTTDDDARAPGANDGAASDLRRLQGLILGDGTRRAGSEVNGDGSIVLLRAATTIEAADAVAGLIGAMRSQASGGMRTHGMLGAESVAIVRGVEAGLLDEALVLHGERRLGARPASRWRAATLVLPLALEMIFDPCDPRQVLELLGLPVSPFARVTRWQLSRALCDAPGVGDVRWQQAKAKVRERLARPGRGGDRGDDGDVTVDAHADADRIDDGSADGGRVHDGPGETGEATADDDAQDHRGAALERARGETGEATADGDEAGEVAARAARELELIEAWLEPERHDAQVGAPRVAVIATVTRVREWLRRRMASGGGSIDAVAFQQCEAMLAMLAEDARQRLPWLAVRQLLDAVGDHGAVAEISVEESGRIDHVEHPAALLAPRDVVVWWQFVAGTARPPHRARWRRSELDALAACGVVPEDPAAELAQESRHWRQAIMAARRRLVLVLPDTDRGERCAAHPLWDEIVARLGLDERAIERLTVRVTDVLAGGADRRLGLEVERLAPLELPPARPTWSVPRGAITGATRWTPGSLQELLECPLRWVLGHAAGMRGHGVPALPTGAMLNGKLAHRLIEELIDQGSLARGRDEVASTIERLLPAFAARLRLPGLAIELEQLRHQLIEMVDALARILEQGALTVAAVEEEVSASWLGSELAGRLDLRLQGADGREIVLDLKWGHGSYREALADGRAVQLAFYAQARRLTRTAAALPATAYFALGRGRLLTTAVDAFGGVERVQVVDGPSVADTIARIERTVPRVQALLADGLVPVTGLRSSAPLLELLGLPEREHDRHYPAPGLPRRDRDEPAGCKYCNFGPVCGRSWEGVT